MRNGVKTAFDVALEYPLRCVDIAQCSKALFDRISRRSLWSEAIRVRVCRCFRYWVESEQVQRLHCSVPHTWNTQRTLLAVFLRDMDAPKRLGMIAPLPERVDGVDLLVGSVPRDLVHSWSAFALVFRHSSHGKGFAAERVGYESLQGFDLAPFLFLSCLDDACLKPTHVVIDCLPVDGMPVGDSVERRTS